MSKSVQEIEHVIGLSKIETSGDEVVDDNRPPSEHVIDGPCAIRLFPEVVPLVMHGGYLTGHPECLVEICEGSKSTSSGRA